MKHGDMRADDERTLRHERCGTGRGRALATAVALCVAGVLASGAHGSAEGSFSVRAVPVMTSDQFRVAGEVVARTESELTVVTRLSEVRTIQVTDDTAITKGGATLRLPDVMVGDKIDVTVARGGEGRLRAVTVTVRTGFE